MYVAVMVYVASRKAAAMLGLHPQTLRRYADQGQNPPTIGTPLDNVYTTLTPICAEHPGPISCATAGSVSAQQRGDLGGQVAQMRGNSTLTPRSSPTWPVGSTGSAKDCSPYWKRLHRGDKLDSVRQPAFGQFTSPSLNCYIREQAILFCE